MPLDRPAACPRHPGGGTPPVRWGGAGKVLRRGGWRQPALRCGIEAITGGLELIALGAEQHPVDGRVELYRKARGEGPGNIAPSLAVGRGQHGRRNGRRRFGGMGRCGWRLRRLHRVLERIGHGRRLGGDDRLLRRLEEFDVGDAGAQLADGRALPRIRALEDARQREAAAVLAFGELVEERVLDLELADLGDEVADREVAAAAVDGLDEQSAWQGNHGASPWGGDCDNPRGNAIPLRGKRSVPARGDEMGAAAIPSEGRNHDGYGLLTLCRRRFRPVANSPRGRWLLLR